MPAAPDISICVCTFRRAEGLRRLLKSLGELRFDTPTHETVVIDNDADRSAVDVVGQAQRSGLAVRYDVEPVQNISRARNRSLQHARGRLVAFIDDDEEADPGWLRELAICLERHRADAVFGHQRAELPATTPNWIRSSGTFDHQLPAEGMPLAWYQTRTSNALVRRDSMPSRTSHEGPFEPAFGLSGGEDVELFQRMLAAGRVLVAAPRAVVREHVPAARIRLRYLASRHLRNGMIATCVERRAGLPAGGSGTLLGDLAWAAGYGLGAARHAPRSRALALRQLFLAMDSLGRAASRYGLSTSPYRFSARKTGVIRDSAA